jgi:hypothetical protein
MSDADFQTLNFSKVIWIKFWPPLSITIITSFVDVIRARQKGTTLLPYWKVETIVASREMPFEATVADGNSIDAMNWAGELDLVRMN